MPYQPMAEGALVLARLVPGAIASDGAHEYVRTFAPAEYQALSRGEQATYELARELWIGDGPLARFAACADWKYANALLSAVHVALGPALMPVSHR